MRTCGSQDVRTVIMSRTAALFFFIVLLQPVVAGTETVSLVEGGQFRMELPAVPTGKEMNLRRGQDTFQSVKIATIINKNLTYKDVQLVDRMSLKENTIIISNLTNNDSNVYKIQVNGDRASEKKYNLTVYPRDSILEDVRVAPAQNGTETKEARDSILEDVRVAPAQNGTATKEDLDKTIENPVIGIGTGIGIAFAVFAGVAVIAGIVICIYKHGILPRCQRNKEANTEDPEQGVALSPMNNTQDSTG